MCVHMSKGIYTNAFTAATANNCSVTIINRCVNDTPIESYWKCGWKGKTWKELLV
jgi:hypothetical protein